MYYDKEAARGGEDTKSLIPSSSKNAASSNFSEDLASSSRTYRQISILLAVLIAVVAIAFACSFIANLILSAQLQAANKRKADSTLNIDCDFGDAIMKEKIDFAFLQQMHLEIRNSVVASLKKNVVSSICASTTTDAVYVFMSNSDAKQFFYLTGVQTKQHAEDAVVKYQALLKIVCGDNQAGSTTTLFVPRIARDELIWNLVTILTPEQYAELYNVDKVYYTDNTTSILQQELVDETKQQHTVLLLQPQVAEFQETIGINSSQVVVDSSQLQNVLTDLRNIKTAKEMILLRKAMYVSSMAHVQLMKHTRNDLFEFSLESLFRMYTGKCGLLSQAYDPIVGSGPHSAVLHYIANDDKLFPHQKPAQALPYLHQHQSGKALKKLHTTTPSSSLFQQDQQEPSSLVLVDAGAELYEYASDITRTFPSQGRFTDKQKKLYNAVLSIQKQTIQFLKPNQAWPEIAKFASLRLLEEVMKLNLINTTSITTSDPLEELYQAKVHSVFQPHGLGHLVGLQVHDTTVYPVSLLPGMIITIEPGIYFNRYVFLEKMNAVQAQYVNMNTVHQEGYFNLGGVRIEDDILITETGIEILTRYVPKEIDEIEALMNTAN